MYLQVVRLFCICPARTMDDTHVPVNSPVESHTDHSVDSPASHSRDWVKSVQVKSEQLQQRSPKGITLAHGVYIIYAFRVSLRL